MVLNVFEVFGLKIDKHRNYNFKYMFVVFFPVD